MTRAAGGNANGFGAAASRLACAPAQPINVCTAHSPQNADCNISWCPGLQRGLLGCNTAGTFLLAPHCADPSRLNRPRRHEQHGGALRCAWRCGRTLVTVCASAARRALSARESTHESTRCYGPPRYAHTHTRARVHTHAHAHAHTRAHTHSCTHARTHARTQASIARSADAISHGKALGHGMPAATALHSARYSVPAEALARPSLLQVHRRRPALRRAVPLPTRSVAAWSAVLRFAGAGVYGAWRCRCCRSGRPAREAPAVASARRADRREGARMGCGRRCDCPGERARPRTRRLGLQPAQVRTPHPFE
jgi:hypothetical protein